jgi:predicted nucleic acid-binding protein
VIYLDTSVLGALFFREPTASAILTRLETVSRLETPALVLRAGDILHLAIVRRLRANLAPLNKRQSLAANHYSIPLFPVS